MQADLDAHHAADALRAGANIWSKSAKALCFPLVAKPTTIS